MTKTLMRFGKSMAPLMKHKAHFFSDNDALLAEQLATAAMYARLPKRNQCMNCGQALEGELFHKMGVGYVLCGICGHLNGCHIDTDEFCRALYSQDDGKTYARNYITQDAAAYSIRVRDIYAPKVDFLMEALRANDADPVTLTYADFGAGAGYMLSALGDFGIKTARGFEISAAQIALAHAMRPGLALEQHTPDAIYDLSRSIKTDVICMIGVLEHLQRPRELLANLRANPAVRYIFLSVPLLSFSVYVELAFPNVMQRHLSGGHTHLYSDRSIQYFCNEYGFERVAEWWFGTDILDFYRALTIMAGDRVDKLLPIIDDLQIALDTKKGSSEVHLLLKKDQG